MKESKRNEREINVVAYERPHTHTHTLNDILNIKLDTNKKKNEFTDDDDVDDDARTTLTAIYENCVCLFASLRLV